VTVTDQMKQVEVKVGRSVYLENELSKEKFADPGTWRHGEKDEAQVLAGLS